MSSKIKLIIRFSSPENHRSSHAQKWLLKVFYLAHLICILHALDSSVQCDQDSLYVEIASRVRFETI